MDGMGNLHSDMWWWSWDINKGDRARSTKWRKGLRRRLNQRSDLQYRWMPWYDLTKHCDWYIFISVRVQNKRCHQVMSFSYSALPLGAMDRMGTLHGVLWWGHPDLHKGIEPRSRKWRKGLRRRPNQRSDLQYHWVPYNNYNYNNYYNHHTTDKFCRIIPRLLPHYKRRPQRHLPDLA